MGVRALLALVRLGLHLGIGPVERPPRPRAGTTLPRPTLLAVRLDAPLLAEVPDLPARRVEVGEVLPFALGVRRQTAARASGTNRVPPRGLRAYVARSFGYGRAIARA